MFKKLSLLFFLCAIFTYSQEHNFYHFGINEGLSQGTARTIIKDKSGFIWIGTQEGLNRFDGSTFKVYKTDYESENSICGNYIEKLLEFDNYIFIGTKNNGICYYNKLLNTFQNTTITKGTCTGLVKFNNQTYASILNDGLYKITLKKTGFEAKKIVEFTAKNISCLYSSNQKLFIGLNNGLIYTLQKGNTFIKRKIDLKGTIKTFFLENNYLWIGSKDGLYLENLTTHKVHFVNLNNNVTKLKNIQINRIIKQNNNYYIATDSGLYIVSNYKQNDNKFTTSVVFKGDKNNLNSITSNRVYDILLHHKMLFIGTNKLDILALKEPVFKSISTKSNPKISNNHIYATLKTDSYLFVGTRNGLNCIDSQNNTTVITKQNSKLAGNVIRGITKDSKNNLWIATTKGVSIINLSSFNPKKPKIKSIYNNGNPKSLSSNNTRSVFEDSNHRIWIATYGGGINLFTGNLNKNSITFKVFEHHQTKKSISSNFTFNINQSNKNTYWISTENGFNKLTFLDNSLLNYNVTVYKKEVSTKNSLTSDAILTTYIDANKPNIIWIGTENGLHKLNALTNKITYYGTKNGLTNLVIYSILKDQNSNIWVTTNSGLFNFNTISEKFTNYTIKDGLKNIEYNLGSEFYDKKNEVLYFGGTNGLDYFSPNNLDKLYHEDTLFFTSLTIKEKEIDPLDNKNIVSKTIMNSQSIQLKFNDFPAKLIFSDLGFSFPKNNNFVYKLLPNDADWNPLKNQKEINFLNLKHGDYTLLIQGKGKNKFWNKNPLKLKITVLPPWYKSNVAYAFYFVLLFGSLYMLYKFQLQRSLELKETARLKELNELKTKLYSNITHEFRTPLTVILGITDSISENINTSPKKINSYLEKVKRNANNLLQLVNQILDLSKIEKGKTQLNLEEDDIVKHLKYLIESFSSYAGDKKISLIFYNEINKLNIAFDKDKVTKIISNLISNAVKFSTSNSKIIVYLKKQENHLLIQVKDFGLGIPKKELPFIFDRFYQVKNNNNNTGTGIGLALTKELVELMNGTIKAESIEKSETTFTIKLPIISKNTVATNIDKNDDFNTEKPTVLIVEDNKDVRTYIKLCIEKEYNILTASNGKEGIALAFEKIPDIIISDVMMPLVDGYKLCEVLKEDIKTNHIPIVLLTAKNSQQSKIEGLRKGADAYLSKPFNKEELLIRIKKLIAIRALLQHKFKDVKNIKLKGTSTDKNELFIKEAIKFININIENSEYNNHSLAEDLCISESQLYRKLKAVTTHSTAIFIRKIRLQTAKKLLETTNKNISEVCYDTGFNDPSWFSKAFKYEYGFPPSDLIWFLKKNTK